MDHFRVALKDLKEYQPFSMYWECEFWLRFVAFLITFMSSDCVEVDQKEIVVLRYCPRPLYPTDTRSFFCLAVYYWRFVHFCMSNESPLITLTQKYVKFESSMEVKEVPKS